MEHTMELTTHQANSSSRPFIAGLWLIAGIPLSILLSLVINGLDLDMDEAFGLSMIALIHAGVGALWARALGKRTGLPPSRLMNLAAGVGFALFVIGGRQALVVFDPLVSRLLTPVHHATHLEFGVVFVIWTGVVTGGTGFSLGLGLKRVRTALELLVLGFLSGSIAFLIVAFFMDLIGFRVGTPRADELPSMVIVTLLGIWSAALIGSAVFGQVLARLPGEVDRGDGLRSETIGHPPPPPSN
jgi:hypothetical protein